MSLSRRTILGGAGILPLVAGNFSFPVLAQTAPIAPAATEVPPILFVHGNGEHAALWSTTLWRMESNGVARDRVFPINFTAPLARTDNKAEEPQPSSTEGPRPD